MHNYLTNFLFLLLMIVSFSVGAKNDVIKVYDKGLDGNVRNYSVACPNGKKTSVSHMLGKYGKDKRSAGISTRVDLVPTEVDFEKRRKSTADSNNDMSSGTASIAQTADDLKRKALKLVGAKNKVTVCLYPKGTERQCQPYSGIDAAAKAACDLAY